MEPCNLIRIFRLKSSLLFFLIPLLLVCSLNCSACCSVLASLPALFDDGIAKGKGLPKDPLVIEARYYYYGLSGEVRRALSEAIAEYNTNGKSWKVGLDRSEAFVQFRLKAIEKKDRNEARDAALHDEDSIGRIGNWIALGTPAGPEPLGAANKDSIIINYELIKTKAEEEQTIADLDPVALRRILLKAVFIHEIGHSLGATHKDPDAMVSNDFRNEITQVKTAQTLSLPWSGFSKVTSRFIGALLRRIDKSYYSDGGRQNGSTAMIRSDHQLAYLRRR